MQLGRTGYGHFETPNQFGPGEARKFHEGREDTVCWTTKGLKITRFRVVSDPGFPAWDVSYCTGTLADGTKVWVELPFSQIPKRSWKTFIVNEAKREGVYAKGLGIFEAVSALM